MIENNENNNNDKEDEDNDDDNGDDNLSLVRSMSDKPPTKPNKIITPDNNNTDDDDDGDGIDLARSQSEAAQKPKRKSNKLKIVNENENLLDDNKDIEKPELDSSVTSLQNTSNTNDKRVAGLRNWIGNYRKMKEWQNKNI